MDRQRQLDRRHTDRLVKELIDRSLPFQFHSQVRVHVLSLCAAGPRSAEGHGGERTCSPAVSGLAKGADEFLRIHGRGKHRVVVGDGVLVLFNRRGGHAVAEGDHLVAILIA